MVNSIFLFLNLGGGELFIVLLFIVLFFGSDKLPEIARGLGKGIREIKDAKNQIQNEIQKNTSGFREELEKHTLEIQSAIEKVDEGVKQELSAVSKTVSAGGKELENTIK